MCLWLNFSIRVHVRSIREGVEKWCWQIVEDPRRPSSRSLTRPSFGYYYSTLRRDLCVDSRVFTPKKVYIWKKNAGRSVVADFCGTEVSRGGSFCPLPSIVNRYPVARAQRRWTMPWPRTVSTRPICSLDTLALFDCLQIPSDREKKAKKKKTRVDGKMSIVGVESEQQSA